MLSPSLNKVFTYLLTYLSHFFQSISLNMKVLTLKVPIMTAADDNHKYFFHCFSEKIRLDVSRESSARQSFYLKHQALFSLKIKVKN